jgi:hypothetical protein
MKIKDFKWWLTENDKLSYSWHNTINQWDFIVHKEKILIDVWLIDNQ